MFESIPERSMVLSIRSARQTFADWFFFEYCWGKGQNQLLGLVFDLNLECEPIFGLE